MDHDGSAPGPDVPFVQTVYPLASRRADRPHRRWPADLPGAGRGWLAPCRSAPGRDAPATRRGRADPDRATRGRRVTHAQSRRCITATSSQRLNLRPTSRSMPTSSKPQRAWRARDAVARCLDAGHHGVEARRPGDLDQARSSSAVPMPSPPRVAVDVDRVLDRRAVRRPAPCTATARRTRPRCRRRRRRRWPRRRRTGRPARPPGRRASGGRGRTCSSPSSPRGCRSCGSPRRRRPRPAGCEHVGHGGRG